jgi:hypothetical protein
MESLLKKCISIIRLESTSTKWTATPEDYIMNLLTYLHHISLDVSIKHDIKAVTIDASTLTEI